MERLKAFFKHKFVIVSLCFILAGVLAIGVMYVLPKANKYTSVIEYEEMGKKVEKVVVFEKDYKIHTKYIYEDGKEREISAQKYEIKKGVLYVEGDEWGKIDFFGIHMEGGFVINGQKSNIGYENKAAKYVKYASFALIGLGAVMFGLAAYVGLTKKKKPTKPVNSQPQNPNYQ